MHRWIATYFAYLYILAMLKPVQPYVEYILNQDYIAEFLCINKNKPQLQCNGKCHLVKEIEKQQENNPLKPLSISLENYPIGFVNIYNIKILNNITGYKKLKTIPYRVFYFFDYNDCAYQPPDLV